MAEPLEALLRIRCENDLALRLQSVADRKRRAMSSLVREWLWRQVEAEEKRLNLTPGSRPSPPDLHQHLNEPIGQTSSHGSHQSVANPPVAAEDLTVAARLAAAATAEALGEHTARTSRATSTGTVKPVKPRKSTPS